MATYTTRYNLGKWSLGENPGATALNTNWDLIDSAIWNTSQSLSTYTATLPLKFTARDIALQYNQINLTLSASSHLDTIQNIATTSTPTFGGLTINGNAVVTGRLTAEEFYTEYNSSSVVFSSGSTKFGDTSNDTHQFTGSILLSGDLTSSGNINVVGNISGSNLKLIGDITASNLRLSGAITASGVGYIGGVLTLGTQATATAHAVRADRSIATTLPLSGGGNLTTDRTVVLNYRTTNLQLSASSHLDTIQDITTTSSPTFTNLNLTGYITASTGRFSGDISGSNLKLTGNITASNIRLSGQISSSGTGNNYIIGNTSLGLAKAPTEKLSIYGNINQSGSYSFYNNFNSGWAGSGWRLDQGISNVGSSKLELDDLTVRGTMNVYSILINQIRATNGSLFISSCARVTSSIYSTPTYYLTFEDVTNNGITPFAVNDIIMCQRVQLDNTTIIKRIVREITGINGLQVTASIFLDYPADAGSVAKGDDFVRIGNTANSARQGVVYLTSDDSGAPFMDVINGVNNWATWTNSTKLKVRVGNLSGVTDGTFGSLSDYGLYAKGGVYLVSSASENSIALKVDSASAQLTMKQANNTVFDFNTQTAISKISGWSFDKDKLWANNLAAFNYLELHGSGSNPYIYAAYGQGYDDIGIVIGNPPSTILPMNTNEIGLIGFNNHDLFRYFTLTNLTQSIAGWNFDQDKLYNKSASVYIVKLDGTNRLISVYDDKVKMYYTDSTHYGISSSFFHLGSTNTIAGWTITSTAITSPQITPDAFASVVSLNAASTKIGLHIITDAEVMNVPGWLSVGTIVNNAGNVTIDTGIQYVKAGDTPYFRLSDSDDNIIAGWNFTTTQIYNGTDIILNSANKSVSVGANKVKMYYTDATHYGISASGFHLGSTNQIAGFTFNTQSLSVGTYSGNYTMISMNATTTGSLQNHWEGTNRGKGFQVTNLTGSYAYTLTMGEILTNNLGAGSEVSRSGWLGFQALAALGSSAPSVLFQIGVKNTSMVNSIAGWNFDTKKLWNGTNSTGIILSTSASAYLSSTGTGFEVWDSTSPKMIIGKKNGGRLDWNFTTANSLTISGSIIGSTILASSFTTRTNYSNDGIRINDYDIYISGSGYENWINPSRYIIYSGASEKLRFGDINGLGKIGIILTEVSKVTTISSDGIMYQSGSVSWPYLRFIGVQSAFPPTGSNIDVEGNCYYFDYPAASRMRVYYGGEWN